MKYFVTTFSNTRPPTAWRCATPDGKTIRTLCHNRDLRIRLMVANRPAKEFFTFRTERGDELNAYIVKPRDFDPRSATPVLLTQYSGPGSQQVLDRWTLDWEDALVDAGYIVVCTDSRGTGCRGEALQEADLRPAGRPRGRGPALVRRAHMAGQP